MQSVISAIYPILKTSSRSTSARSGLIQLCVPVHGLDPAADRRHLYRQEADALLIADRHGLHAGRPRPARHRRPLFGDPAVGGADRSRLLDLPSGILARRAHGSGGRHGLAQSLFRSAAIFGSAIGPLLAAFIVLPRGQGAVAWFALAALAGIIILSRVGFWYRAQHASGRSPQERGHGACHVAAADHRPLDPYPRRADLLQVLLHGRAVELLHLLSHRHLGVSVRDSQLLLFVFLGAVAAGTIAGGRSATASAANS